MQATELKLEFLGTAGLNSFVPNVSSPRAVMDNNHLAQKLPLIHPDEKMIKSGIEYELAKYINDVRVDQNCIVKAVIPRYANMAISDAPCVTLLVEYMDDDTTYLDYIQVENHKSTHTYFGYLLSLTEDFSNISYNGVLNEGTILAKTASYGEDHDYRFGRQANIALMSHPSVAEDGYAISESFARTSGFHAISKRVINITKDTIPLNVNGTPDLFKFLPNIGEEVREDGLLCALRDRNGFFSVSDMSDRGLSEVDYTFDNPVYVPVRSKVIDIKVIRGNYLKPEFPSGMTGQLDDLAAQYHAYNTMLVNRFDAILEEKRQIYGSLNGVRISPKLTRLIADSTIEVNAVNNPKQKLCCRKVPIDQYRIEVTVSSIKIPNYGYKLTDLHGAKGVVCRILPDHHMPVDKWGVRADVIADDSSTGSRMNPGRAYEVYLNAARRDLQTKLVQQFGYYEGMVLTPEAIQQIGTILGEFYSIISPVRMKQEFLDTLTFEELSHHVYKCLSSGIRLYYPPDNERNICDVIEMLEVSPYKPNYDTLVYTDDLGRVVETVEPIRVGQIYLMFLEKIANSYSAVSSSRVNNFGFAIKGSNTNKYRYPHALSPTKTLSETEIRILVALGAHVQDLTDQTFNPISHKLVVKHILTSPKAFDRDFDIDRSIVQYAAGKSVGLARHLFNAVGFDLDESEANV